MISADQTAAPRWRPTRFSTLVFRSKAAWLQAKRGWRDLASGLWRLDRGSFEPFPDIIAESRTPLWSDPRPEEQAHQLGKVQNLRRAAKALDRTVIPAGETFSFWRQVGRASRRRGYVDGRMLQQGCLVPAIGGGLCQLSNALYEVALRGGTEIVERHAHSRVVPGSAAAYGRDATIAWNYIDFRFRATEPLLLETRLERDALIVRLRARSGANPGKPAPATARAEDTPPPLAASSCATCNDTACFRHERRADIRSHGHAAYLVDECWPEFQDYVRRAHRAEDVLGIPFDGMRWHVSRYPWDTSGFARIGTAPLETLARAFTARRLKEQGPERLTAQLAAAERLARRLSRLLTQDVTQLCVAQSLLPFLWRDGHLGGRRFRVLMTRLPMQHLEARLDTAWAAHPERASLHDFRAPTDLAAAEAEALAHADLVITPHSEIARLFPTRSLQLDWHLPALAPIMRSGPPPQRIAFPGPTIARKGAYELREAARLLDLEIVPLGSELEGPDFWRGLSRRSPPLQAAPHEWLREVAAVVQPALVEEKPRRLLAALAAGVSVIATAACGIPARAGLTLVPEGDPAALAAAVRRIIAG